MATIGLSINHSIVENAYVTVDVGFWSVKEIHLDAALKVGFISLVPYLSRAYFLANGAKSYYPNFEVKFSFNPTTWPFSPGTDAVEKAYDYIQTFTGGVESPGEIDWSSSSKESFP